jgi:uncharacterized cupredoxin-like copper-binding protein
VIRKVLIVLLVAAAGLLVACGSDGGSAGTGPVELTLTAEDIAYSTKELTAVAGRPVKLTLENEGVLEHDFTIMTLPHSGEVVSVGHDDSDHDMSNLDMTPEVHVAAAAGEQGTLEFTPAEPGSYEYFCSVPGHKEAGMVGALTVTE